MKRALAAAATAGLIAVIVWQGRGRLSSTANDALATPDACIDQMFRAAQEGDVDAYLDCFAGQERVRLDQQLSGQSRETFASSLQAAVAGLTGRAILTDGPDDPQADWVERKVDRVYPSRNEQQTYRLQRQGTLWRITRVEDARAFQPETAYGTPVFEVPPPDTKPGE